METHDKQGRAIQVIGYCCGCGKLTKVYLTSGKHGEPNRYNMAFEVKRRRNVRGCTCGSRTAALDNFHKIQKRKAFKRPDKTQRNSRRLLRNLKHIEWEKPDAKDYNQIKFTEPYCEALKEASSETQARCRIFERLSTLC